MLIVMIIFSQCLLWLWISVLIDTKNDEMPNLFNYKKLYTQVYESMPYCVILTIICNMILTVPAICYWMYKLSILIVTYLKKKI